MKEFELVRLIEQGEGPYVEFKESLRLDNRNPGLDETEISGLDKKRCGEFAKDIMSLANLSSRWGEWRYIIIGVSDDKNIVGINPEEIDAQKIQRILSELCLPPVDANYATGYIGDQCIGLISIPNSRLKPHQFAKDVTYLQGKKQRLVFHKGDVFIRHMRESRPAFPEEIISMREDTQTLINQFAFSNINLRRVDHPRSSLSDILEQESPYLASVLKRVSGINEIFSTHASLILQRAELIIPDYLFETLSPEEIFLLCLASFIHDVEDPMSQLDFLPDNEKKIISLFELAVQISQGFDSTKLWELPGVKPSEDGNPIRLQLLATLFNVAHILDLTPTPISGNIDRQFLPYTISYDQTRHHIWIYAKPSSIRQEEIIRRACEQAQASIRQIQLLLRSQNLAIKDINLEVEQKPDTLIVDEENYQNPYRRLEPFTEKDREKFFGRDVELTQLLGKIFAYDVVTLLGESGIGKTSLLRAGVIPKLEDADYTVIYARCFDSPCQRIREAIARLELKQFYEDLDFASLMMKFNQVVLRGILILDQAEELFTRVGEQQRIEFLRQLSGLLIDRNFSIKLVISLREDFAHKLFDLSNEIPALYHWDHTLHLGRLDISQAHDILKRPSQNKQFPLSDEVTNSCLEDLSETRNYYPPDLQILGHELFEKAAKLNRPLLQEDYIAAGKAHQIIARFFIDLIGSYPTPFKEIAQDVLKQLVSSYGTKNQYTLVEIQHQLPYPENDIREVLQKLLMDRLISRTTGDQFELVHDYLSLQIREHWLTEAEINIKQLKEMLRNWLTEWQVFGHEGIEHLIEAPQLEILRFYAQTLNPNEKELELIIVSCLAADVDPSPWIRQLKPDVVVDLLGEYISTARISVRVRATKSLSATHSEKAIRYLDKALRDHDNSVQKAAAEALRELGLAKGVYPLKAVLMQERDIVRVKPLIDAISALGGAEAVSVLTQLANKSQDRRIQTLCIQAIESLGKSKPADVLLGLLLKEFSPENKTAQVLLRDKYSDIMFDRLLYLLVDTSDEVISVVSCLLPYLKDNDFHRSMEVISQHLQVSRERSWNVCVSLVASLPSANHVESALAVLLYSLSRKQSKASQSMIMEPEVTQLCDSIVRIISVSINRLGILNITDLPWSASRPTTKILEELLELKNPEISARVGEVISNLQDLLSIQLLLRSIDEDSNLLRGILQSLDNWKDVDTKRRLIALVGNIRSQASYEISLAALRDRDPIIRIQAIQNLPKSSTWNEYVIAVFDRLLDKNEDVQENALKWLLGLEESTLPFQAYDGFAHHPTETAKSQALYLLSHGTTPLHGQLAGILLTIPDLLTQTKQENYDDRVLAGYVAMLCISGQIKPKEFGEFIKLNNQPILLDTLLDIVVSQASNRIFTYLEILYPYCSSDQRKAMIAYYDHLEQPLGTLGINDPSLNVRNMASIVALHQQQEIPLQNLKEIFLLSLDEKDFLMGISQLLNRGAEAIPLLKEIINNSSEVQKNKICSYLVDSPTELADTLLGWMASERSAWKVRISSVSALANRTTATGITIIKQLLQDQDPSFRGEILRTVRSLPKSQALPILKQGMDDPDYKVREIAARIIARNFSGNESAEDLATQTPDLRKLAKNIDRKQKEKSSFALALSEIQEQERISKEVIHDALESTIVSAYRKAVNASSAQVIKAMIDPNTGKATIYAEKEVVETVQDDRTEVSLQDARDHDPEAAIGDLISVESTPKEFGRIATQTAVQMIKQRVQDSKNNMILNHFQKQVGDIVPGVVNSVRPSEVLISLDMEAVGILPRNQAIRGERLRINDRVRALLLKVENTPNGLEITLSRAHRDFLRRMLESEIPEIFHGLVEIRSIAREAGERSKVAVVGLKEGIDPVGACVGVRGSRIKPIVNELNGEKIDIVEWNEDPAIYIAKALSPARVTGVYLNTHAKGAKTALVVVPEDQLSLAIGRDGQSARLAAKLTSWRIDIKSLIDSVHGVINKLQSKKNYTFMLESESKTISDINLILSKKAEKRLVTPEEYKLMTEFIDRVERTVMLKYQDEKQDKIGEELANLSLEMQS
jgi:transcription termination factor NusA